MQIFQKFISEKIFQHYAFRMPLYLMSAWISEHKFQILTNDFKTQIFSYTDFWFLITLIFDFCKKFQNTDFQLQWFLIFKKIDFLIFEKIDFISWNPAWNPEILRFKSDFLKSWNRLVSWKIIHRISRFQNFLIFHVIFDEKFQDFRRFWFRFHKFGDFKLKSFFSNWIKSKIKKKKHQKSRKNHWNLKFWSEISLKPEIFCQKSAQKSWNHWNPDYIQVRFLLFSEILRVNLKFFIKSILWFFCKIKLFDPLWIYERVHSQTCTS